MPMVQSNLHIDVFLSGIAGAYKNSNFIADQVLPVVPSPKESGKIAQYGLEHYRIDFNARGMGGDAARGDWQASTPVSFQAQDWEFEIPVDDRQIPYYDDPFDAMTDATNAAMQKIFLKREDIVAAVLTSTGNFSGMTSAVASLPGHGAAFKWLASNAASPTPVADIRFAMESIRAKTGVGYDNMIGYCSSAVWNALIQTNDIRALYINTQAGLAAPAALLPSVIARAIGLADIFVGPAVKLSTKEGDTANTMIDVWAGGITGGAFGVVCKSAKPSFMAPGFGAIISPTVPGLPGAFVSVDRYREERKRSTVVRAAALFDCIVVTNNLGYLLTGCIA